MLDLSSGIAYRNTVGEVVHSDWVHATLDEFDNLLSRNPDMGSMGQNRSLREYQKPQGTNIVEGKNSELWLSVYG